MKFFLSILIFMYSLNCGYTQVKENQYRIFGEISTVENQTYRGYITWGETKNYWINFFEASKITNPYAHYFNAGDGVIFYQSGRKFAKPPLHTFSCRFGNIRSLRPTNSNTVDLELKNGQILSLTKGTFSDIGRSIQIATAKENITIKWEFISEVHFMSADSTCPLPELCQVAGIVKSSQGKYKGLITWNSNRKENSERMHTINTFLNKMERVVKEQGIYKVLPQKGLVRTPSVLKTDILYPVEYITVNMPNTGEVTLPSSQFKELEIIPISEVSLLAYDDFQPPLPLQGEIITRNNEIVRGNLAYDLDENLNIELLDGKNNSINYRIPFKYIRSIEPKNYKYSYITLSNGNQFSLGDSPDVNRENSGIIVSGDDEIPVYIPWNEVKSVKINQVVGK